MTAALGGPGTRGVADGVERLGSDLVNLYLIEEDRRFTLVDAGLPGYLDRITAALAARGAGLDDVEAVVLTHAHRDHVGVAERLRREAGARVHVHEADAQTARTGRVPVRERGPTPYLWRPATLRLLAHAATQGGLRPQPIVDLATFTDGDVLDVPGRPRVVATPGHTYGHAALVLDDRGVLLTGDALCTRNPLTGRSGPQIPPAALNASSEQALASLDRLEDAGTPVVLPGHGPPWTRGAAEAVAAARRAGPS